ncbi:hypothetical protein [Nisaea sediminum]|uniref:hypothetical protein n=1 Tax=Nisaea sediminum TaxID=2775867 RepID=UPI0018660D4A|nr:hypothetical protein [Nisaea sediminum]
MPPSFNKFLRSTVPVVAIALLLSACQTLGPEPVAVPPLTVGPGEGAASIKLCREGEVFDRLYTVTISKVENGSGMPAVSSVPGDSRAETATYEDATSLKDGYACHMWQFAAAPGTYTIHELKESFRTGQAFGIYGLVGTAMIVASKKNDTVSFATASGHLGPNAPTFEIRDGEVSRLGTLTFHGRFVYLQIPVRDKTGYWDGQSTDVVQEPRLSVKCEAPVPGGLDDSAPIVGNVNGTTLQTLTSLVGREIVLEEPVQPELPGKS